MNHQNAVEAFAALAQETRLAIYRLLVRHEPKGLKVGDISQNLGIVPSTLSGHLAILKRAGLLKSIRKQREIHYSADISVMNGLIGFMLQDCCNGQVEHCGEILTLLGTD